MFPVSVSWFLVNGFDHFYLIISVFLSMLSGFCLVVPNNGLDNFCSMISVFLSMLNGYALIQLNFQLISTVLGLNTMV